MIEINIGEDVIKKAEIKANKMGILRNSIMQGKGNIVGFLGEEIVKNYINAEESNTYDYDLIKKGIKIDVKTKKTKVKPLPHYEASVTNPNQKCDVYAFVRILSNYSTAYICGWLFKKDYYAKATLLKKGQVDRTNNWKVKEDCYNVPYKNLKQFKEKKCQ